MNRVLADIKTIEHGVPFALVRLTCEGHNIQVIVIDNDLPDFIQVAHRVLLTFKESATFVAVNQVAISVPNFFLGTVSEVTDDSFVSRISLRLQSGSLITALIPRQVTSDVPINVGTSALFYVNATSILIEKSSE